MNYLSMIKLKIKSPSLLIKMTLISIIFIYSINIEIPIINDYSTSLVGSNQINFLLFIIHMLSYFEVYSKYLLVGLILIIPDILDEQYLTHYFYVHNKSRRQLFKNTVFLILSYIMAFLLWFILIIFLVFVFRNGFTSMSWPKQLMSSLSKVEDTFFIHIPASAVKFPLPVAALLVFLKVLLGLYVLCLACFYAAFKKDNMSYGIGLGILIYFVSWFLYSEGGRLTWKFKENYMNLTKLTSKFTLVSFFTYDNVNENFQLRLVETLSYEIILILILLFFINKLIRNKDLR